MKKLHDEVRPELVKARDRRLAREKEAGEQTTAIMGHIADDPPQPPSIFEQAGDDVATRLPPANSGITEVLHENALLATQSRLDVVDGQLDS